MTINNKRKSVSAKGVIVHCKKNGTTEKITMTKMYMHPLHVCLVMTIVIVDISVTVLD